MAACTRAHVSAEIEAQLFNTLETVDVETPASLATSRIVTDMIILLLKIVQILLYSIAVS